MAYFPRQNEPDQWELMLAQMMAERGGGAITAPPREENRYDPNLLPPERGGPPIDPEGRELLPPPREGGLTADTTQVGLEDERLLEAAKKRRARQRQMEMMQQLGLLMAQAEMDSKGKATLTGGVEGAKAGSTFGPWGALIGGALGAAGGRMSHKR